MPDVPDRMTGAAEAVAASTENRMILFMLANEIIVPKGVWRRASELLVLARYWQERNL